MRRNYAGLSLVVASLLMTARAEAQEPPAAEPLAPLPPPLVPPPVMAPPQPLPPPPPRYMGPAPRMVWVHVDAPQQVLLQFLSMEDTRWQPVCLSPCDLQVPLDGAYRVVAPGIVSSREVEIEAGAGDRVSLAVHVRTLAQRQTADRLRIAGYISAAVGLGLAVAAISVDSSSSAQPALAAASVGTGVAGLALTITSYVLGEPSSISQSRTATSGALRMPVWREARLEDRGLPRALGLPLLTIRY